MTDTQLSAREVPWMKLGSLNVEPRTAVEAMSLARLDYTVSKREAAWRKPDGEWNPVDGRVAIVRDDTDELYEYVSPDYEIFQFFEAFDFMDTISPRYVAAGPLKGGRQAFLIVEPEQPEFAVGGDDKHRLYAVLRTSHDRSRAIEVSMMMIRYRCTNQLTIGGVLGNRRSAQQRWSIPHTRTMRERLHQAQDVVTRAQEYTVEFQHLAERLMRSRPEEATVRAILSRHITPWAKKQDDVLDTILHMWHEDTERVGFNDTAWGAVNAVSEWFDWQRPRGTPESRFLNALQGITQKALNSVTRELLVLAA